VIDLKGVIGVKSDSADTRRTAQYKTRMLGGVRGALRQSITGGAVHSIGGCVAFTHFIRSLSY
jgi:hypothetical protein